MSESGIERRESVRVPARIEIHFGQTQEAAKAFKAYTANLSVGGLCLRTQKTYVVGTPLRLTMMVETERFELMGVVAWVRAEAIGVRFLEVPPNERVRLQKLVDSLIKT